MKLPNAAQIKGWDRYTIEHEPITSINLMERAALACCNWILANIPQLPIIVFCGPGNNGGDGLAIARILDKNNASVRVYILTNEHNESQDFILNYKRLQKASHIPITLLENENDFPHFSSRVIIIDALFGTGLNRKLENKAAQLVTHLNKTDNCIIAIDVPSGLLADQSSKEFTVIHATHTLTFQYPKLALLLAENEMYFGRVHILDIGLHPNFLNTITTTYNLITTTLIDSIYKKRNPFSHKGSYGHALIISGSYGKMGAAVLCVQSCVRSGVGLVTVQVPQKGVDILQISIPEAMCIADQNEQFFSQIPHNLLPYQAIGIGPGLGTEAISAAALHLLITNYKRPMVVDADALNILSANKDWLQLIPENSILTPHPKEFSRLFGDEMTDFEMLHTALQQAKELNVIIILKGHHSLVATPSGYGYFNTVGNAGMATGGSGDVLTGILTGLLAQGYEPSQAAILGVYLHGLAGDNAAAKHGMDAMIAGDIINEMRFLYNFINPLK